jgi:hypothetical protein
MEYSEEEKDKDEENQNEDNVDTTEQTEQQNRKRKENPNESENSQDKKRVKIESTEKIELKNKMIEYFEKSKKVSFKDIKKKFYPNIQDKNDKRYLLIREIISEIADVKLNEKKEKILELKK